MPPYGFASQSRLDATSLPAMPRLCRGRLLESVIACVRLGNIVAFNSCVGPGATLSKPPVSFSSMWGPAQRFALTALGAGCQLFLFDREDFARFELEIAHDAGALGDV